MVGVWKCDFIRKVPGFRNKVSGKAIHDQHELNLLRICWLKGVSSMRV